MFLAVAALSATANANITFQDNRLVLSVAVSFFTERMSCP